MKKLINKVDYGNEILSNIQVLNRESRGIITRDWMDAECVELCDALNSIKGIVTTESCCGHNYQTYKIFFKCSDLLGLRFIQSCIDNRYWEHGQKWDIKTQISDVGPDPLDFLLESKSSNLEEIMIQVNDMIETFNYYLNHENRLKFIGLDYSNFIFEEVN